MTETPARSPTAADGVQPAADSPLLAPDGAPLCYVVDEESSIRHFLSLVLHGSGVDTVEFPDGATMRKAIEARAPALVFHNISLESTLEEAEDRLCCLKNSLNPESECGS
jgi:hypothetical protein